MLLMVDLRITLSRLLIWFEALSWEEFRSWLLLAWVLLLDLVRVVCCYEVE